MVKVDPRQQISATTTYDHNMRLTSVVAVSLVEPQYALAASQKMSSVLEQVEADLRPPPAPNPGFRTQKQSPTGTWETPPTAENKRT